MLYGTSQPHASTGLAMFAGPLARGVEYKPGMPYGTLLPFAVASVSIDRITRTNRGLRGLSDWFSDGVNAMTNNVTSVIGAITGSTAQAEAQRNALAIAQLQADTAARESAAFMSSVPWIAGAAALVAGAFFLSRKA